MRTMKKAARTADDWNARHPVGTCVVYFPIRGEHYNGRLTRTRSIACKRSSGDYGVFIEGMGGYVSIEHLCPLEENAKDAAGPVRGDVGGAEATRDPIFLFQRKRQVWTERDLPEGWEFDDDYNVTDDCGEEVSENDPRLRESGNVGDYWSTERVFFTREEGERYGKAKAYNYPNGWRVYCVCAEQSLATVLRKHSLKPTGILEPEDEGATSGKEG